MGWKWTPWPQIHVAMHMLYISEIYECLFVLSDIHFQLFMFVFICIYTNKGLF